MPFKKCILEEYQFENFSIEIMFRKLILESHSRIFILKIWKVYSVNFPKILFRKSLRDKSNHFKNLLGVCEEIDGVLEGGVSKKFVLVGICK